MQQAQPLSDAVWTVPNVLTFLRLAAQPLFLWLAIGIDHLGWAVAVGATVIVTDLADGAIARRSGKITKLGTRLDPLADRIGVAATVVIILVHELAWAPLVWTVVVRDVLLAVVGVSLLKATGRPIPPVSKLGKLASFGVSVGLGLFLVAGAVGGIERPNEAIRTVAYVVAGAGVAGYLAAFVGYVRAGLRSSPQ